MTRKSQEVRRAAEGASYGSVVIRQPEVYSVALEVTGTATLIQNNFGQKTVEQLLAKHMGISVSREKKKPRELTEAAKIVNMDGKVCLPPVAFKKGMLTAASQIKSLKKTHLRTGLFVEGSSIPITYESYVPRMDMVRTQGIGRTPDVRFRPSFDGWKARLIIQFADAFAVQTIVDLLNRAGKVGVGEWRPEKDGTFGTYRVSRHISDEKEIEEVHAECTVPLVPLTIPEWAMDMDVDLEVLQKVFNESSGSKKEISTALQEVAQEKTG
jgi:hypothetical protein